MRPGRMQGRDPGRLAALALHLWEDKRSYHLQRLRPMVPTTDNGTGQAIGRFPIRTEALWGIQSRARLEAAFLLPDLVVA